MNREVHVRFWESPEVKVLRATRHRFRLTPQRNPLVKLNGALRVDSGTAELKPLEGGWPELPHVTTKRWR